MHPTRVLSVVRTPASLVTTTNPKCRHTTDVNAAGGFSISISETLSDFDFTFGMIVASTILCLLINALAQSSLELRRNCFSPRTETRTETGNTEPNPEPKLYRISEPKLTETYRNLPKLTETLNRISEPKLTETLNRNSEPKL